MASPAQIKEKITHPRCHREVFKALRCAASEWLKSNGQASQPNNSSMMMTFTISIKNAPTKGTIIKAW